MCGKRLHTDGQDAPFPSPTHPSSNEASPGKRNTFIVPEGRRGQQGPGDYQQGSPATWPTAILTEQHSTYCG